MSDKLILVGKIVASHGIKGNVLIKSYTDPIININNLDLVDQEGNKISIDCLHTNQKGLIVTKMDKISDRNSADLLKGLELYCYRSSLLEPSENEFYINDLENLSVVNEKLEIIGKVAHVVNYGAGDIIEILFSNNKSEFILFTNDNFPEITKDYIRLNKDSNEDNSI